jgi:hypothetical protein
MARRRRIGNPGVGMERGNGGIDYDLIYDSNYNTNSLQPQGLVGSQLIYIGSEWGLLARLNGLTQEEFQRIQ